MMKATKKIICPDCGKKIKVRKSWCVLDKTEVKYICTKCYFTQQDN
jgi:predicted RNA-binding Zn-ribbon protein involved in translation (DUF1610 family)